MTAVSYFNQSLPSIVNIRDGSGTAITRATLKAMTLAEYEALGDQEDLQRVYANAAEAKMRGVTQPYINKLLMGRLKNYSGQVNRVNLGGPQSIIQPFIVKRQKTVVNSNWFEIEAGADVNGYRRTITVKNNALFSQQALPRIDRYFLTGNTVIVAFVGASGAAYSSHFVVISAVDATAGGVSKATVTIEPTTVTSATFAGYTDDQKAAFQPTGGLVVLGTNSVSDYQAWCPVGAVDNNGGFRKYWVQNSRKAHSVTKEYLKAIAAKNANEFFKTFSTLPYAEQLKQQDIRFNREWWTSVMWGQPDEGQDDTWQTNGKLREVNDIVDGNLLEYNARAEGIEYLLAKDSRVIDYAGQPLNLDTLGEYLYQLKRHRQETSDTDDPVQEIVLQADKGTANNFKAVIADYYRKKYGISYTQEIGKGGNEEFMQTSGLDVNSYDLDDHGGVKLTVISDPTLFDMAQAAPAAHRGAARYAMLLDWSDIDVAITKSAAVDHEYPSPNDVPSDFKCVIARNERNIKLYSQAWTVVIDRPERHLMLKNFSTACPTMHYTSCTAYAG